MLSNQNTCELDQEKKIQTNNRIIKKVYGSERESGKVRKRKRKRRSPSQFECNYEYPFGSKTNNNEWMKIMIERKKVVGL